jgi:hypothetical protein
MATMSTFGTRIAHWFGYERPSPRHERDDPIGDNLRAAVEANARAKMHNTRSYEARVQSMIDELFLRMKERDGRHQA